MKSIVLVMAGLGLLGQNSPNQALERILEQTMRQEGVPSIGAVIIQNSVIHATAAVGERVIGSSVAVGLEDTYHLGSLTKSFTATVLAKLVEDKKLEWNTTLGTIFKDVPILVHYQKVTVLELLIHRASFPANVEDTAVYNWDLPYPQAREMYLRQALQSQPEIQPTPLAAYSNIGYVLASQIAERVSGQGWQELVTNLIFRPLKMNNCAFGTRFTPRSQPHGHDETPTGLKAVQTDQPNGNSPVLYGADGIRCSIGDLGLYIQAHLNGARGQSGILSAKSFQFLHAPRVDAGQGLSAACGWFIFPNGAIWHNGSNTQNYAEIIINPRTNNAVGIVTNAPTERGARAAQAAMDAIGDLLK